MSSSSMLAVIRGFYLFIGYLLGYYILVTEDGDSLPHGCVKLTSVSNMYIVTVYHVIALSFYYSLRHHQ